MTLSPLPSTLAAFLEWLVRTSWQAAILVCLVAVVQTLLRQHLSPPWRCYLWLIVMIKLALPLPPRSTVSAFNLLQPGLGISAASITTPVPATQGPMAPPRLDHSERSQLPSPDLFPVPAERRSGPVIGWTGTLLGLWAAGVFCLVGRLLFEQKRLRRYLRGAAPVKDAAVLSLLERSRRQMNVRKAVSILEINGFPSPALYGSIRPRLLLPSGLIERFSEAELRYIFLHELAHVKRGDIVLNWLVMALQIVHWFNPFVWYAFSRMRIDREMACDARVLQLTGVGERHQYGATVIKLLEEFNPSSAVLPVHVGILESRNQLQTRIRMIADFKRWRGWPGLAMALIGGIGITFLTEAQSPRKAPEGGSVPSTPVPGLAEANAPAKPGSKENDLLFVVLDRADNQPLTNSLLKVTCCSGNQCFLLGRFTMPPAGQVSIRYPAEAISLAVHVSKEGYVPKLISWRPGRNDLIDGQYIAKLDRGRTLGGIVQDVEGRKIAQAKVFLQGPGIEDPIAREHLGLQGDSPAATTDERGLWITHSAPQDLDRVSLAVQHPDFATTAFAHDGSTESHADRSKRIPLNDLLARTAVLTLVRGEVVTGQVLNAAGQPIRQANVLLGEKFAQQPRTQRTDEEGRFRFERRVHERSVTVQAPGFAPDIKSLDPEKEVQSLTFQLAPGGVIKGRVVDEEGQPLGDVTVTVGTALWRGQQTLAWDGKTDEDGQFAWDSAPTEGITVGFLKPGYMIGEAFIAAGPPAKTITLQKERKFAGLVLDAETGHTIAQFRVTPGETYDVGNAEPRVTWQPFLAVVGRDGAFTLKPERSMQIINIEAEGYLPITAPLPTEGIAGGGGTNVFRLRRGTGLSGVVHLPNGEPAAGAEVAVRSRGTFLELGHGRFNRLGGPEESPIVRADGTGRFALPPKAEITSFIAVHQQGYGEMLVGEITAPVIEMRKPWVLQPWGRVEGVLRINQRLAVDERVALTSDLSNPNAVQLGFNDFQTRTDREGRFVFTNVPPGKRSVARLIPQGKHAWSYAYAQPIEVPPGKIAQISLGGTGLQVVGRAVVKNGPKADWQSGRFSLHSKRPQPPATLRSPDDYKKWADSSEVKASLAAFRTYPVIVAADGSFRVDDVPPGIYVLDLALSEGGGLDPFAGRSIAELKQELEVPKARSGASDAPIDLGIVELLPPARRAGINPAPTPER